MGLFGGDKKKEVVYKEDKDRAKRIRDAAKGKLQQAGIDGKETKKGVGRDVAKTEKGRKEQQAREKINRIAGQQAKDDPQWHGVSPTKKGGSMRGNRGD